MTRAARPEAHLRDVVARTRPVVHAGEQVLPVMPALDGLLPWAGLRRGSTVVVAAGGPGPTEAVGGAEAAGYAGAAGHGEAAQPRRATGFTEAGGGLGGSAGAATSVALALVAGASQAGSWCAAVGLPSLGLVAAVEAGIDLARFPLVAAPPTMREWASVVAAVADALEVVLVCPPGRVHATDARRLTARVRERGAVLVVVGGRWDGADVRLSVRQATWAGLGQGHGHLCARHVEVVAQGRGAAARPRAVSLWLPDADGTIRRGRRPDLSREQPAHGAVERSPVHAARRKEVRVAG